MITDSSTSIAGFGSPRVDPEIRKTQFIFLELVVSFSKYFKVDKKKKKERMRRDELSSFR